MRDRFSGSMITGCLRGRDGCRHFGVHYTGVSSGSGGVRHGTGPCAGAEDALGRTRSTGHLDRRKRHAVPALPQIREPGILHRGAAGGIGHACDRRCAAATSAGSAAPSATSPVPITRCSAACKRTGARTSLIVDPPDGRIPALTPAAQKLAAADRDFRLALMQSTETCKNKRPAVHGGKYDPTPRFASAKSFLRATTPRA